MLYQDDVYYDVLQQLCDWQAETSLSEFVNAIAERVVGQPELSTVLGAVYAYIMCLVNDSRVNHNLILTAPSGSGKTETYRALKEYFAVECPDFIINLVDISQITASGYKGAEPFSIVEPFANQDTDAPVGLCVLDEFDKVLAPSITSAGVDAHKEVQANLLAIVGQGVATDPRNGHNIDTSRMMFLGLGAFDMVRQSRIDKASEKIIGFGTTSIEASEEARLFEEITREDMVKAGAMAELIGRFPFIVSYQPLSSEMMDKIIDKILCDVGKAFDARIEIGNDLRNHLHEQSASKYGIRLIDAIVRKGALDQFVHALSNEPKPEKELVIKLELESSTYTYKKRTEIKVKETHNDNWYVEPTSDLLADFRSKLTPQI